MVIAINLKVLVQCVDQLLLRFILSAALKDGLNERVLCLFEILIDTLVIRVFFILVLAPSALDQRLHDHGIAGKYISRKVRELLSLVVVVRITRVLDRVLDQLLERCLLANELNQLGLAASAAENYKSLFFVE